MYIVLYISDQSRREFDVFFPQRKTQNEMYRLHCHMRISVERLSRVPAAGSVEIRRIRDSKLRRSLLYTCIRHSAGIEHVGYVYQRPTGRSTRSESRSSRTPCAGRTVGPFPRASLGGVRSRGTDSQAGERQRRPDDVTATTMMTTTWSGARTRTRLDFRPARRGRSRLHLQTPVDHAFRIFVDGPATKGTAPDQGTIDDDNGDSEG